MGMSYSWIAFDEPKRSLFEAQLKLKPSPSQSWLCGVPIREGKYAVHGPLEFFEELSLLELSRESLVVLVNYSDTVSFGSCTCFDGGMVVWSVKVDGDDLSTKGTLPDAFEKIREDFEWRETEPLYSIPPELGEEIVGLHYGVDFGGESAVFYERLT